MAPSFKFCFRYIQAYQLTQSFRCPSREIIFICRNKWYCLFYRVDLLVGFRGSNVIWNLSNFNKELFQKEIVFRFQRRSRKDENNITFEESWVCEITLYKPTCNELITSLLTSPSVPLKQETAKACCICLRIEALSLVGIFFFLKNIARMFT